MICQNVSDFMSQKSINADNIKKNSVFAYPNNNVNDIARIMKDIHVDYLPVLKSPCEKILIGFIEFNNIKKFC